MDKKIIKVNDAKIEEYKIYQHNFSINEIVINKIVVSNKFPLGKQDFKFFIGYKDVKKIRPLCIFFLKMSTYRSFYKNNSIYFMIKEEKVLDKYNEIWEKFSNIMKIKFNSDLVYNKKYIKTENKINAKESFQCFYIPVILIDSVYRKDENYDPKVVLENYRINKD